MRSEADAYDRKVVESLPQSGFASDAPRSGSNNNSPIASTESDKQTETLLRGHGVPTAATLEIKTCQKHPRLNSFMPQLWFSRTPWIMIGLHCKGTFTQVHKWDASSRFPAWESRHQDNLRKLAALIAELKCIVRETNAPCTIIYEKDKKSKKRKSSFEGLQAC